MSTRPTRDDLAPNEILVHLDDTGPDSLGRRRFVAYWLDDYLPPNGVRGQHFHADLEEFTRRTEGRKATVRVVGGVR